MGNPRQIRPAAGTKTPVLAMHLYRRLLPTLLLLFTGCAERGETLLNQSLRPDPPVVDFGDVSPGGVFTREVTFENLTDDTVAISDITADGPANPAFSFELERSSVGPGNRLTMLVVFAPTEEGPSEITWLIRTTSSQASTVLTVKGRAISDVYVSPLCGLPEDLDFGAVVIGSTKTLEVPICNLSTNGLIVELIEGENLQSCTTAVSSASYCWRLSETQLGPDGRFELPAEQTYILSIEFSPTSLGPRQRGSLRLRTCDNSACDSELGVSGHGVDSGLSCNPNLDFGEVSPEECVTKSVLCENTGNGPVTISNWGSGADVGLPTDEGFEFEPSAPRVLSEGERSEIDVSFCPTRLGSQSGALYIDADQPRPRTTISLFGAGGGPDIEVLPGELAFGLASIQVATQRSILITNTGFADLEITSINADALSTGLFSAPGSGPGAIAPGGSMHISVEFQPLRPGPVRSELIITSNDPGNPEIVVALSGEGISLPSCQFVLSQPQLSFGRVRSQHSLQKVIGVRNAGRSDCLLGAVHLDPGSDPEFGLSNAPPSSLRLAPDEVHLIAVQYAPQQPATNAGVLEISLSSFATPVVRIPLAGEGIDDGLLVAPRQLDFGNPGLGCSSPIRTVTIYNPSAMPANISMLEFESGPSGPFTILQAPILPMSIPPGARLTVDLQFAGTSLGPKSDALHIAGLRGGVPITYYVTLQGEPNPSGAQVERFEQVANRKVDLLFVVDNSESTAQERALLADSFPAVIQRARAEGIDYQVGLITTDPDIEAGRLVHPGGPRARAFSGPIGLRIITETTQPTAEAQFRFHAQAFPIPGGRFDEAGLWAANQAIRPFLLRGHNSDFLRPDAALTVVYLSDESDQSSRTIGAPFDAAEYYRDALLALKGPGAKNLVTISAIVGDAPSGCNGPTGAAAAGPRYIRLARETGGYNASICTSDWPRMMADLSFQALGMRSKFFLEKVPLAGSIQVEVDGVQVPATSQSGGLNWRYEASDSSLVFTPFAQPIVGAQITVTSTSTCR